MAATSKLGTADSRLGNVQLAYAGADALRPLTGAITGQFGTSHSLLGNMRVGLGSQEGDSSVGNIYIVSATTTLTLDQTAALAAVVRACTALSAISLTAAAGRNNLLSASSISTLDLWVTAGCAISRGVAAESVISPAATATCAAVRSISAESVLSLDVAADSSACLVAAESAISLDSVASVAAVRSLAAESALSLAATAGRNNLVSTTAQSALTLDSSAVQVGRLLDASAASDLTVTGEAACTLVTSRNGSCTDFLVLVDMAAVKVVRNLAAHNALALSHAEHTARPWYVSAETALQTVGYAYDQATDTFYPVYEGLQDSASTARPLTAAVHQAIPLAQSASVVRVKPTAIAVSAESVLELLGEIRISPTATARDWLSLGHSAAVDKCKLVRSRLNLSQEAAVLVSVPRAVVSALGLSQAATYSIVSRGVLGQYKPFVGEGAAGSPTPPAVTIGPPEHVALPFQLFYPAEGVVTDSVTLRAPNLCNKDRLSFNRILRETRDGTLIVFADPIWPKVETLVLSFSGLRSVQAQQLLAFLETHLGEEIGLLDWEGRAWKGVVTAPTEPVVQDSRDSFSASLEFEGELVSA
jgi:hypothetical protein